MMKINLLPVIQTIGSSLSFSFVTSASQLQLAEAVTGGRQFAADGQITVAGQIINNGQFLNATGRITANAHYICSRCLEDFVQVLDIPFAEKYQDVSRQEENMADTDELSAYQGEELDISPLIRETLLLAEPLQPLCREDCCGLCPQCGVNLNVVDCDCQRQVIDPRLAALQNLLKE